MNIPYTDFAQKLLDFIDAGYTAYHAVSEIRSVLDSQGFISLDEGSSWDLKPDKGYYVERNGSSVIAFTTGTKSPAETGITIAGVHTDSPCFKIKGGSFSGDLGYITLPVEVYGSPIRSTWLDRDLILAGRLILKRDGGIVCRNIQTEPAAAIPNPPIHLNREINKGFEYKVQNNLTAHLFGSYSSDGTSLARYIGELVQCDPADIVDYDLFLVSAEKACIMGKTLDKITENDPGYFTAPRIDNLSMCFALLQALVSCEPGGGTTMACFFDNEEVGSKTFQGADSSFLGNVLRRLVSAMDPADDAFFRTAARSFLISADAAHGYNPNFKDCYDADQSPLIGKGPVIKYNSLYRYTSTGETAGYITLMAEKLGVPLQSLRNNADIPCGSTIGPVVSSKFSIQAVDLGCPIYSMHSLRETGSLQDHYQMLQLMTGLYEGKLRY